jgi:methylated-DNA-[protein]-cysteine S-methyltransferase
MIECMMHDAVPPNVKNIVFSYEINSPVGKLRLLSSEKGLCYIGLSRQSDRCIKDFIKKWFPDATIRKGGAVNKEAARQIKAYFNGKLRKFTVKLDLRVKGFYGKVLQKVKAIPYGKTRTYGEIAAALGNPGAARAVGGANSSNPIPIIIPCHRVVAANGLGGYGGGLNLKGTLLRLEHSSFGH